MNVFASCDSKYFLEHARAFYNSAKASGYRPIIEVVNPCKKSLALAETMEDVFFSDNLKLNGAGLCSRRFHSATEVMERYGPGLLITDIDCYFNSLIPVPEEFVGLFLRPGNPEHMAVAAGIVWLDGSRDSVEFMNNVSDKIHFMPSEWYVDQIALVRTYKEWQNKKKFFCFTNKHMDWEFNEGTFMWTGKGPRKHRNIKYVTRKQEMERL